MVWGCGLNSSGSRPMMDSCGHGDSHAVSTKGCGNFFNSLEDCQLSYVNCCGMSEPTANKVDCYFCPPIGQSPCVTSCPPLCGYPAHTTGQPTEAKDWSIGLSEHCCTSMSAVCLLWYLYCDRTIHRYGIYGSIVVDFHKKNYRSFNSLFVPYWSRTDVSVLQEYG
jgi:hypothetical protein